MFERRGGRGFGGGRRFGGQRRSFGGDTPKPVKVGEEYDVDISEVGSRGDGIARVKNFVVFVNGTKEGEKAHIKITEVRNRFAIGEKVGATQASAASVESEVDEEAQAGEAEEESIEETSEEESEEEEV